MNWNERNVSMISGLALPIQSNSLHTSSAVEGRQFLPIGRQHRKRVLHGHKSASRRVMGLREDNRSTNHPAKHPAAQL
jgi:hypothetical protein